MKILNIRKILVPIDFSMTSLKALEQAVLMARKCKAELTLVHVVDRMMSNSDSYYFSIPKSPEYDKAMVDECESQLVKLAEKIKQKDSINIKAVTVIGNARNEIINMALKVNADIIVMGTHGISGVKEFVIGSNAIRVISEATCPVLSIRQTPEPGFKKILLPFRNTPHSREKVNYAIEMAEMYGASIYVLGIDAEQNEETFNKLILQTEQIKKIVEHHNVICETKVITGSYLADEIMNFSKEIHADLIVVMSDLDKMSISDFIMGPFAQQIVNHSHVPILSIRPTFNADTVNLRGFGW